MKPPLRVAILECDTPLPNTEAKYGGFGSVFEQLLTSGVEARDRPDAGVGLQIAKYQVELDPDNYPKLDDIDSVLITGSRTYSAEDDCGRRS